MQEKKEEYMSEEVQQDIIQDITVAKPEKVLREVSRHETDVETMVSDILEDPRFKRSIVVPICDGIPELRDKYSSAKGKDKERASKYIAISLVVCKWAEMLGITDGENIKFELSVEFTVDKTLSRWLEQYINHEVVPLATLYKMVTDKSVVEIIKNLNNTKSTLLHLSIATFIYNEFKLDLRFADKWLNQELLPLSQAKTMLQRCLSIYEVIAPTKDKHNSYKFISFLQEYVKVKEIDESIPYNIHPNTLTRNFVAWLIQNSDTVNAEVFEKLSSHLVEYNRSPKEIRELFALHQTIGINTTQQSNVEYVTNYFKTNCSTSDIDKLDRWRKLPTVKESYNKYLHKAIEDCMLYLSKVKLKFQVQRLRIKETDKSIMIEDIDNCESLDECENVSNGIKKYLKELALSKRQRQVDEQEAERARRRQAAFESQRQAALEHAERERKAREELEVKFKQEEQRILKEAAEAKEQERLAREKEVEQVRREAIERERLAREEAEETVQRRVSEVTTKSKQAIEAAEQERKRLEEEAKRKVREAAEARTKAQEAEQLRSIEVQKAKEAAEKERKLIEEEVKRKLEAAERERQALAEAAKRAELKRQQEAKEQQRLVQQKEADLQQQAQISQQQLQQLITTQQADYERSIGELNKQLESGRLDNQHLLQQLNALKLQEQRQKRHFSRRFAALTKTYSDATQAFDKAIESIKSDLTCKNTMFENQLKATHQAAMEELKHEKEAIEREVELERNELKRRESDLDRQYQQLVGVKAMDADMKQLQQTYLTDQRDLTRAIHELHTKHAQRLADLSDEYKRKRKLFNTAMRRYVTRQMDMQCENIPHRTQRQPLQEQKQSQPITILQEQKQSHVDIRPITILQEQKQPQPTSLNLLTSTTLMTASYATMLTISLYRVLS